MQRLPEPLKSCSQCGKTMTRKRHPSGRLEGLREFRNRKYCNQTCYARSVLAVNTETEHDKPTWATLPDPEPSNQANFSPADQTPAEDPVDLPTNAVTKGGKMSYATKKKLGLL